MTGAARAANPTARIHAAAAICALSISICRNSRDRAAPSEMRRAISVSRADARASMRLATLEQARRSKSAQIRDRTQSGRRNSRRKMELAPLEASRIRSGAFVNCSI